MKSKSKILYVITKSNFGGASRYVYELATLLPKESYDVEVAVGGAGILKDKLEEAGIPTHSIANFQRDISLSKEIASVLELWHIVRSVNPDIIHLNSSKAGGIGAVVARLAGVKKIIFTAHGWPFFEKRNLFWKGCAWFFSWLTTLLTHTTILVSQHDLTHGYMPFVKKRLTLIRTAVPEFTSLTKDVSRQMLEKYGAHLPSPASVWVGSIGEYIKNKNLLTAIQAIESANKKGATRFYYTLIGIDGDEREALERYITEHDLRETVTLLGYIDDARKYLSAFDIFILPSLKEGMPYGLLEAGKTGLFCIGSNVGGIPEIIENGTNGILIDPHDQKTIENALLLYATNKTLSKSHALNLKIKIDTEFGIKKMLEKTIAVYSNKE